MLDLLIAGLALFVAGLALFTLRLRSPVGQAFRAWWAISGLHLDEVGGGIFGARVLVDVRSGH